MDLIYRPDVAMIKKQLLLTEEGQRGRTQDEQEKEQGEQPTEKKGEQKKQH
jgi:hypothetical protein